MSLIHQALKKLEGSRRGRPPAGPGPVPAGADRGGRKVNAVLLLVLIVALGTGLAAYSYLGLFQKKNDSSDTAPRQVEASAGQGTPENRQEARGDKTGPDASTRVERGMIFFRAGDYTRAAAEFRAAVEAAPANPVYQNNLGIALFRSGDETGAGKAFREALRLRPDYPEGLNNYGSLLATRGEHDRALEVFEKAVKADPSYADAHLNRGVVLENAGMTEEAVEAYRSYLRAAGEGETKGRVRRKIAELRAGMIMDKTIK